MHPAASVILFTTSTGLGYGLLVWLSILISTQNSLGSSLLPLHIIIIIGIALVFITFGLLSSLWHLGHPERAWRALSQWKTSWLSREGVFAVLVYPSTLFMGISAHFEWYHLLPTLSLITAVLSVITVYCTAMIYASLKTIPAWHNRWTTSSYLLHSMATGGVLYFFLINTFNLPVSLQNNAISPVWIILFIALAFGNKLLYWQHIHKTSSSTDKQTAIGIKGKITQLDPPHSSANYLMKEMGFQIARNKSNFFRFTTMVCAYLVPLLCLLFVWKIIPEMNILISAFALINCMIGMITERFLFFAEAKHVVNLYY